MDPLSRATILVASEVADDVHRELDASELDFERAGAARGVAGASEVFIVATSSLTALALLFEKLRRLRLPRTYVRSTGDELEIWTDGDTPDGRILVVREDGTTEELPDGGLSLESLAGLLLGRQPSG
jgi:hypothetical protein